MAEFINEHDEITTTPEPLYNIQSGQGFFVGFVNDSPKMTTFIPEAARFEWKEAQFVSKRLNDLGLEGKIIVAE